MRRIIVGATVSVLIVLAGCSNEAPAGSAAPSSASRTTTSAPPTYDPYAGLSSMEKNFVLAFTANGYTNNGGNADIARTGELICDEIRSGERPASTQAVFIKGSLTDEDAALIYRLAHDTMCPQVPLPDPNSFSTGTYEVGVDIPPGKYRSPGGDGCYWARLAEDQTDILDNNLSDGPSVFTVQPSDGYIELNRCTWTLTP